MLSSAYFLFIESMFCATKLRKTSRKTKFTMIFLKREQLWPKVGAANEWGERHGRTSELAQAGDRAGASKSPSWRKQELEPAQARRLRHGVQSSFKLLTVLPHTVNSFGPNY
jgi:hypothetical protein